MIRFLRQKDRYNCLPISILNALKWKGRQCTYRDLKVLKEIFNPKVGIGTANYASKLIFILEAEKVNFLSWEIFKDDLKNGYAFIIDYIYKRDKEIKGHAAFIEKIENNKIVAHNFYEDQTTSYLTFKELKNFFNKKQALFRIKK